MLKGVALGIGSASIVGVAVSVLLMAALFTMLRLVNEVLLEGGSMWPMISPCVGQKVIIKRHEMCWRSKIIVVQSIGSVTTMMVNEFTGIASRQ